jgi:YHS domain-containing protein
LSRIIAAKKGGLRVSRFLFGLLLTALSVYLVGKLLKKRTPERTENTAREADLIQDPVCLTYLPRENALEVKVRGATRRFCSKECAAAFEKRNTEAPAGP